MSEAGIDTELLSTLGGRVHRVRGHHPLVLEDTSRLWLVASGSAAVLTSRVEQGLPVGKRRLLFRATPGMPLFAVSDARSESSNRLIVLSIEPVTLYEIPLNRVDQAMALVGVSLVTAIETWVERLSAFAAAGLSAPPAEPLPERGRFAVPPGAVLRPPRQMVRWVQVDDGSLHLFGSGALRLGKLPLYMPLGSAIWVSAPEPARLQLESAESLTDRRDLVRGLALFNSLFQARLRQLAEQDRAAELARLGERAQRERQATAAAYDRLAGVLDPEGFERPGSGGLLGATEMVAGELGMPVHPPGAAETHRVLRHPFEAIARASRLRFRRVLLTGPWWQSDCGPLLAELAEDGRPVALLRREGRGYEIVDPDDGSRRPVDEQSSRSLAPQAFMIYRRLPDGVRGVGDLLRFALRGRLGDLGFVLGLALVTTLLGMLTPQATALIMDNAIPDANVRLLLEIGFALVAAAFGMALFGLAQSIVSIRINVGVDSTTQAAVWDRLLNLRMNFFKGYSSGDLLSRAMAVSQVTNEVNGQTLSTLLSSLMALLNLGLLYYYNARLALIALGLGLAVALASAFAGYFIRRYYRELMELQGHFFGLVVQMVHAVGKLRVAGAQRRAFALWARRYAEQLELIQRAQRGEDYVAVYNQAIPILSSILLFWFGASLLAPGPDGAMSTGLSVGVFLAFNTAMGTFLGGATALSGTLLDTLDTLAKARRIRPLLDAEPEVDDARVDPGVLEGEIEMLHVDFQYSEDGASVLRDISLRVHPGEFVAFTGPSGSGKSTLFRLLLGFESPTSGSVRFDGRDLSGLDVPAVRRQLGVVLQSGRINEGSIYDNISAGAPLSLDQVWEAVEDAGLAEDLRAMPMGLHTVISEGGTNLSGGQRQRLLIARALAQEPRILLLDEATSALDNRTQAAVSEALDRRKVTRLVIAHRLSTIRNADRIYVLDGGRIVETGSFDELVDRRGLFASMIARQVA